MTEREDSCIAGTKIGGMKAAAANKAKHGAGFYAMIGAKGGKLGHTGGFAFAKSQCDCNWIKGSHKIAQCAGKKGGQISKRKSKQPPRLEIEGVVYERDGNS